MSSAHQSTSRIIPVKYPCAVRRLTIQWDGNEWKVVHQVRVSSMTLPAPDPLPAGEQSRGFWIEAVDGNGDIYQREVMPDPLLGMELFDKEGEIKRINHPSHQVSLEILLPDLPEITELHLISNPIGATREPDKPSRPRRTVLKLLHEDGGHNPDHSGGGHQH